MQTLLLLSPILAGIAVVVGAWWLERWSRRAGLAFGIGGILLVAAGTFGLVTEPGWPPVIYLLQGAGFFYFAWWKHLRPASQHDGDVGA